MEDARALLNSLMGADRNAKVDGQRKARSYKDDDINKDFLLGLCPHSLFTGTKLDLGPSNKHSNEDFKEQFEADVARGDPEALRLRRKWRRRLDSKLRGMLGDVDRRIAINKQRMEREKETGGAGTKEQADMLTLLREEVSEKLKKAEKAADDGNFEESRKIMSEADAVKRKIEDVENRSFEKYKKDHICPVCGLIIDAEEVEAMKTDRGWHINGRQHLGYKAIRAKIKEFEEEDAQERKDGVKSVSPSPAKATREDKDKKGKRERSRSRSGKKPAKAEEKRPAERRSASRRKKGNRSRSRSAPRRADKKDGKKRGSPSPKRRSRSRRRPPSRKKKRSPSRKRRSPSRKKRSPSRKKRRSPSRKSPSRGRSTSRAKDAPKKRKAASEKRASSPSKARKAKKASRRKASSGSDGGSNPPPPEEKAEDAARGPPPPPPDAGEEPPKEPERLAEGEDESDPQVKAPVRFFLGLRRSG